MNILGNIQWQYLLAHHGQYQFYRLMGNQAAINLPVAYPSRPNEWTLETRTEYCEVLRNNYTHEPAELYIVPCSSNTSLERNIGMYQYRRTHNAHTVGVYQVEGEQGGYLCNGVSLLKVKTQRIPTRLSDKKVVSQRQGMAITKGALLGYKELYQFFPRLLITDDMVGFTQNGQIKVWVNSNFALNEPDIVPSLGNRTVTQSDLVSQVFSIVQQHVEGRALNPRFKDAVTSRRPRTFAQAIQLLRDFENRESSLVINPQSTISGPHVSAINKQINHQERFIQPTTYVQQRLPDHQIQYNKQTLRHQAFQPPHLIKSLNQQSRITQNQLVRDPKKIMQVAAQTLTKDFPAPVRVTSSVPDNKQLSNLNTLAAKSRLQQQAVKEHPSLLRAQLMRERHDLQTDRSRINKNFTVQFNQNVVVTPRVKEKNQSDTNQTVRRPSVNHYRKWESQFEKKPESTNLEVRKFVNNKKLQPSIDGTRTFTSRSLSKDIITHGHINSRIPASPQPPMSTEQPSVSLNSQYTLIHLTNHPSSNSSRVVQPHSQSNILPSDLNNSFEAKTALKSPPVIVKKAEYKVFPKPSHALQRLTIEKIQKPSTNSSAFEKEIISALNGISAIEFQNNKTISKLSTDPSPILAEINQEQQFQSQVAVDNAGPAGRKLIAHTAPQRVPPIAYRYEFERSKEIPGYYEQSYERELQQHQRYATPKFEFEGGSQKPLQRNFNAQIQKLIREHEADKEELLKRISEYQISSRLHKGTGEPGRTQGYKQQHWGRQAESLKEAMRAHPSAFP